jgi:hypothetical protein
MALSELLRVGHAGSERRGRRLRAAAVLGVLAFLALPGRVHADPASPFTIANTDSPDPVASGSQLTYTITMVNSGGRRPPTSCSPTR